MAYIITRLPSAFGALVGEGVELDEDQLAALFSTYTVAATKDGPAFIPAKLRPCPATGCLSKTATDCGGGQFHRLDENVESLTGLMIDSDAGDVAKLIGRLVTDNLTHFVWQTYSHTAEAPKHRVFVPFDRPLPIKSKQQWSQVFWPALIKSRGLDPATCAAVDKKCKNAGRLYYAPSMPPGGTQRAWAHWGTELDWSGICDLNQAPLVEPLSAKYRDPPRPPGEFAIDLAGLRERLSAVHADAETRSVLALLVKGEALCPPSVLRKRGDTRTRRASWLTATVWIANCAAGNEHAEELIEVARASYERECTEAEAAHEEPTRWGDIEKMLEGAMCDAPEYRAREAHRRELREFANALGKSGDTSSAAVEGEELDPEFWKSQVTMGKDRNGETQVNATIDNIKPILLHHPTWHGAFKFNEYKQTVEIWGGPTYDGTPRPARDSDNTRVSTWFARQFKFKLNASAYVDHIIDAAEECSYHPLRDYLNACKAAGSRFPGILDRWLFEFCNVVSGRDGTDVSELIRVYGRKFLISCVARARRPGVKVDTMPVFVGNQGARKSTLLATIADNGRFFTDAAITFDGSQNSSMVIATNWIVEAPELEGMARTTTAQQRATLSRGIDTFRPPYGRSIVSYPRISVFAGSTNEPEFLRDTAGNRRFWVMQVGEINVEGLAEATPSLWAEAVAAYEAGEQWWLTPEEQRLSDGQNEQHMVTDQLAEKIRAGVARDPRRKDFYTVNEILTMLDLPVGSATKALANSMRRAGFITTRRYIGGLQCRGYLTPEEILTAVTLKSVPAAK